MGETIAKWDGLLTIGRNHYGMGGATEKWEKLGVASDFLMGQNIAAEERSFKKIGGATNLLSEQILKDFLFPGRFTD